MTVEFVRRGPETSEADVVDFETRIRARLPEAYRVFMLESNGGVPVPNYLPSNQNVGVDGFFSLVSNDPDYAMDRNLELYGDRYPSNLLAIASSAGGNLLCIKLDGNDTGAIYLWDHEFESDDGELPGTDNLTKVADTLDDFLEALAIESDLANDPDVIRMVATGKVTFSDPDFKPEFD